MQTNRRRIKQYSGDAIVNLCSIAVVEMFIMWTVVPGSVTRIFENLGLNQPIILSDIYLIAYVALYAAIVVLNVREAKPIGKTLLLIEEIITILAIVYAFFHFISFFYSAKLILSVLGLYQTLKFNPNSIGLRTYNPSDDKFDPRS